MKHIQAGTLFHTFLEEIFNQSYICYFMLFLQEETWRGGRKGEKDGMGMVVIKSDCVWL